MAQIAVVLGTRPELIKCKPLFDNDLIKILRPVYVLQQIDLLNGLDFDSNITIPIIDTSNDRLNNIIISILNSDIWLSNSFKAIMVQGDTAVAYAGALVAFHRKIPLIHLEAGLRTYNLENPWPEEGYRKMIDSIANIALCPSFDSANNLEKEGFDKNNIHIVGNTSIDCISAYKLKATIGNKVLVTLHRRENWSMIKAFFEVIENLANIYTDLEFILPIHPNPLIRQYSNIFNKVKVCDPLNHEDLCRLLAECNCVISDSGGIQEEASYLGKHIFCCRKITERTELITPYLTFTPTPEKLKELFLPQNTLLPKCLVYGNGDTHLKVLDVIKDI
jgi:UDP-N-acetylglucosamine 2-epimerase (non-hydrolysing)